MVNLSTSLGVWLAVCAMRQGGEEGAISKTLSHRVMVEPGTRERGGGLWPLSQILSPQLHIAGVPEWLKDNSKLQASLLCQSIVPG